MTIERVEVIGLRSVEALCGLGKSLGGSLEISGEASLGEKEKKVGLKGSFIYGFLQETIPNVVHDIDQVL